MWFDAGKRDEFFLQLGARGLSDRLKSLKIKHVDQEHEYGHMDMQPRYDFSVSMVSRRLARVD